jgi:hypothetical protein
MMNRLSASFYVGPRANKAVLSGRTAVFEWFVGHSAYIDPELCCSFFFCGNHEHLVSGF